MLSIIPVKPRSATVAVFSSFRNSALLWHLPRAKEDVKATKAATTVIVQICFVQNDPVLVFANISIAVDVYSIIIQQVQLSPPTTLTTRRKFSAFSSYQFAELQTPTKLSLKKSSSCKHANLWLVFGLLNII